MNLLLDNGALEHGNLGDAAMLATAYRRLRALWPEARIRVPTSAPRALAAQCPGAEPLPLRHGRWKHPLARRLAARVGDALGTVPPLPEPVREAVEQADLVVACGGGFLNDTFRSTGLRVLATLEAAAARGKPAVCCAHGVGPAGQGMMERMRRVLPALSLVALREGLRGPALLAGAGVARDRIVVTGDDAVEPAYAARPARPGSGIGLSVRGAPYAGVGRRDLARLRKVLGDLGATYVPLPLSFHREDSDAATLKRLALPYSHRFDALDLETLLDRVGECGVVVTGSYHAGVFALSQGIPVVALVASEYYRSKFEGLAERFGADCRVRALSELEPDDIEEALAARNDARERLLERARAQIRAGLGFYERLGGLA